MGLLLLVSLVWAFSFGLIKDQLSGLDSTAVAFLRLAFALLVFLPFLRRENITLTAKLQLALIGALQFGAMYLCYQRSFAYLSAYEVAIYTIFTPIYLSLLDACWQRKFWLGGMIAALLAVLGAAIVKWQGMTGALGSGFLLVQISNLCFAAGQLAYKNLRGRLAVSGDTGLFGWLLLGAVLVTALVTVPVTDWGQFRPDWKQWLVIAYLGVLASGLCFFWWNLGATRVATAVLAVFNNAKIPAAVLVSLLVFREQADVPRLLCGLAVMMLAVWLANRKV
ncbi:MAG: EamA family transporter [Verrucomicrobiales bacterium]|jgi:drug/metabolite transporter (DMT)-like permease|nr:EamA family transporter [Verrucomicrobiales bacterium]